MSPGTVLSPVVAAEDLRQFFLDLPQPVAVVTGLSHAACAVRVTGYPGETDSPTRRPRATADRSDPAVYASAARSTPTVLV